jgi:hypothetical protein
MQAIPAAIGVGGSLIGGIQGKGAAKRQEKLAREQLAQLQPLIQAQIAMSQFGLDKARELYPAATNAIQTVYNTATGAYEPLMNEARGKAGELYGTGKGMLTSSLPYLMGAATGLEDLQKFYRPFMFDGQRAIDRFLPSKQRTEQLLAPEFGNINQGYRSASENIARFAPRGGGRVSTLARADIDRQKQLSDTYFQGREGLMNQALGAAFQGASGEQNRLNSLQALGLGQGQLGLGAIGQGNSILGTQGGLALQHLGLGGQAASNLGELASSLFGQGINSGQGPFNLYSQQANRAYGLQPQSTSGKGLGGYLVDLFSNKGIQDKLGGLFGGGKGGGSSLMTGLWEGT